MAGEQQRLRWILDFDVDDSSVLDFVRRTEAQIASLVQRAQTQQGGFTAGGAGGQSIAAELGRLQAQANEVRRLLGTAGKGVLLPSTLQKFEGVLGPRTDAGFGRPVTAAVAGALEGRRGFRPAEFERTAQDAAALEAQNIRALREQVGQQQALTEIARRMGVVAQQLRRS